MKMKSIQCCCQIFKTIQAISDRKIKKNVQPNLSLFELLVFKNANATVI